MDIDQVTRTIAGTGRRQAVAGLLAGATALGTQRLAAAKKCKKKKCKKCPTCDACPTRDTCPQQACCSCGGASPELCGTIEPGATLEETLERCRTFCQSVGGGVAADHPVPDSTALCDSGNVCRRMPCPLP